jgi:hypothetical protein
MDKAQRAQLLRLSYRVKGGIPFASTGIRRPEQGPARPKRVYMPWPDIVVDLKRLPKDMHKSGQCPRPLLSVKRGARESALTRMSRKLCLKLPKVQLSNETK